MQKIITIKKGLDIKITGEAVLELSEYQSDKYSICPSDFRWIVPKMLVNEGDMVQVGTPLFCSKDEQKLVFVSPVSGHISEIVRGEKRKIEKITIISDGQMQSVVIDVPDTNDQTRDNIVTDLLRFGLWPTIRQRPFDCIANYNDHPKNIVISCFDSSPLAPDYNFIFKDQWDYFYEGILTLSLLTEGATYVCLNADVDNSEFEKARLCKFRYFKGPHPAGNVGTQINQLCSLCKGEIVWYLKPQDVVTIGKLYLEKRLDFSKVIALTGSCLDNPRYIKTIKGASLTKAISSHSSETRIISGNILTGKTIKDELFIGYYDDQITAIAEGGKRKLFGWLYPGFRLWSFSHTYISWLYPKRIFNPDTTLHGGRRTIIMTDIYDKVFPIDIFPAELLKACISQDIEKMEDLGIYEVVDEDFALCDVVCPSKTECQQIIYDGLTLIRRQA